MSVPIILGSSSPRRQYLMQQAGFEFTIHKPDVDENFPDDMPVHNVAKYLAEKKANALQPFIVNHIVVTADTVVIVDKNILNKPADFNEAFDMLQMLSGRTHHVRTGVCITFQKVKVLFDDVTVVTFSKLTKKEIEYYIHQHKPFDKAGAYGAQDFIGMIAIEKIEGSYFNVMGLPIHKVYQQIKLLDNKFESTRSKFD
ncbi:MAG: Maf family protein [Cyclobacteriaceae bacterium]|jgi:septum formation protein|nr:Maf family protein [Cyclobacteriaceae bacterium]